MLSSLLCLWNHGQGQHFLAPKMIQAHYRPSLTSKLCVRGHMEFLRYPRSKKWHMDYWASSINTSQMASKPFGKLFWATVSLTRILVCHSRSCSLLANLLLLGPLMFLVFSIRMASRGDSSWLPTLSPPPGGMTNLMCSSVSLLLTVYMLAFHFCSCFWAW